MFEVLTASLALIVAFIALFRAQRDHKSLETEKIRLANQVLELKRALKFRGHLASEIAHEIKNPITAILCSAETLDLVLADKLDESQRLSLRYIREYGENLHKLVSDFLDLSRAEAGGLERKVESIDLNISVASVTGLLSAIAERKGVSLKNLVAGKEVWVSCDPIHLKQILFNLVHNAIKFTPKNGEISVYCTTAVESKKVQITVEDSGVGIAPEKVERIFQPYVTGEKVSETIIITEAGVPQQGVGIGLALCKSLVELGGGQIKVSSVQGKGSIFSFTVDLLDKPPSQKTKSHQSFQDLHLS